LLQSFHSLITAGDNKTLSFPYDPNLATSNMNVQPPVAPTRWPPVLMRWVLRHSE
jgi:hypothetical protein